MKMLLVEDSRTIAMVMRARLESFGHEVRHAANGQIAVELFQNEPVDLIMMDIEMPGMNGFETTARIRALEGQEPWAWTPIIFVTATDTDSNLVMAIEAGGDDFISKTAPANVLQAKMKAMSRIAALRMRLSLANRQLQDQANRDGLTGLLNRRAMDMRVDTLWENAVRSAAPFGLLMLDVDNFKNYNDHYGHLAGDECLRAVATCIGEHIQQTSDGQTAPCAFAARYGGEEFAVIIHGPSCRLYADLAASLVDAVSALRIPHEKNGEHGVVTLSVGAACASPATGNVGLLFHQADELLYKAKAAGRNRAEIA